MPSAVLPVAVVQILDEPSQHLAEFFGRGDERFLLSEGDVALAAGALQMAGYLGG
jgi:hypothetical protein